MTDSTTPVKDLKAQVRKFVDERNWNQHHSPKNLAMSIAIEAAELMEVFQWQTTDTTWKVKDSESIAAVEDELADVMIYCLALANQLDIDITEVVGKKMERNQQRFPPTAKLRSQP